MARVEMRRPIQALLEEKTKFEKQMSDVKSRQEALGEKMQKAQRAINDYKEAMEALPNSNASKLTRQVFEREIAAARKDVQEVQTDFDVLEKDRMVCDSKIKSLTASWKELEKA